MQLQQKMFKRYGFSYFKKRLTQSERFDIIVIISNIEKNKNINNNTIYKKTFNVYDDIMRASIENIQNKNLNKLINNYTISSLAKYLGGSDMNIHNINLIYNNPLTVNDFINKENENSKEKYITCIVNLSDYTSLSKHDLFYAQRLDNVFDIAEYNKSTSQEKINPLNGCLKVYPMIENATDWINCPTNYGDVIFINSSIMCKYNMNHGLTPMKSLHIQFKNVDKITAS
jgi:hypothetical protein